MARLRPVIASLVTAGAVVLAASAAGAGASDPLVFDPDPVSAGSSTTGSSQCQGGNADVVFLTLFDVDQGGGVVADIDVEGTVDEQTQTFAVVVDIPAGAPNQTVEASALCVDTLGENTLSTHFGTLEITAQVTTTAATTTTTAATTTIAATTTAPVTTAAPPSTTLPITLPNTGADSSSGPAALIGLGALAVGIGLIVVARRRSAA